MSDPISASEFSQLRAFVRVGETLSFSRAAQALGVTPSALSQTVRGLEERLGVRLLNRTTRSVSLTDAGERLLRRAGPAVEELGSAVVQVREAGERPSGVVRVHAFRVAAEEYVMPALTAFHRDCPDVVVDLTCDDAVVDVVAGGFDLAIRIGEVIERDMVAVRLGPDLRQIAVASPGYIALHGAPRTPAELVDHACIRWRWPGQPNAYNWEFAEDGAWFEVAVTGPLIVNSKEANLQAAVDGLGVAFTVADRAVEAIAAGRLVPLLEAWAAPFPGYHLCYPQQRHMAPAVRTFIDAVRRQAA